MKKHYVSLNRGPPEDEGKISALSAASPGGLGSSMHHTNMTGAGKTRKSLHPIQRIVTEFQAHIHQQNARTESPFETNIGPPVGLQERKNPVKLERKLK